MTQAFLEQADTPLGRLRFAIFTADPLIAHKENSLLTQAFEVVIQPFELRVNWLPEYIKIDGSRGWRILIKKNTYDLANLTIELSLQQYDSGMESFQDTGEGLAALCINSEKYQMHLGTEDIDQLYERAEAGDGMPRRLANELYPLKQDPSIYVQLDPYGLRINAPDLYEGEKIYFHTLAAWQEIRPSEKYPDEEDVSSWYAVDRSKKWLDQYLEFPE